MKRGNKGFTLIELMIVIAIIAILAAILVPNFLRARQQSQLSSCQSNLKNIATACEMYSVDNNGHYPTKIAMLVPSYLRQVPQCPATAGSSYETNYTQAMSPDSFDIPCPAPMAHPNPPVTANVWYDSAGGLTVK